MSAPRLLLLTLSLLSLTACPGDKEPATETGRPHLVDNDGDGYGADSDCDDASAAVSPGADELCNGIDDDCNGLVDEVGAEDGDTYYPDADGDGYGDLTGEVTACSLPDGFTTDGTDCDDHTASRAPGLAESCDGLDNDCDEVVDEEGATGGLAAHPDADGDGFGDPDISVLVCEFGEGYASNQDDCDDTDAEIKPGAEEVCDDVDNDCNDEIDDDATDQSTYYEDGDADGYGLDDSTIMACDLPTGYARRGEDCDDDDRTVNPGAAERCDDEDNDCDGEIDDDAVDADAFYEDDDADGYGATDTEIVTCDDPGDGYATLGGDCDEEDADVNPGVTETWYDGLDSDCDGASDYDQDGDGFVLSSLEDEDEPTYDPGTGEVVDDGSLTEGGDCDDTLATVNPDRRERCDDIDNDCDGEVDDDPIDARTWYTDADDDGYGDDSTAVVTCSSETEGDVRIGGDCDDADADVSPGETENCPTEEDGVDNDCDGSVDECVESGWVGYFIVGKYDSSFGWDCINYYSALGDTAEISCDSCDFSLEIKSTYEEGFLEGSYDECDWADFEYWEETDEFTSIWGFAYEPDFYSYSVAYYYYAAGSSWYPMSYFYYGYGYYDYRYLQWTSFVQYDAAGLIEAGLFYGYPYEL